MKKIVHCSGYSLAENQSLTGRVVDRNNVPVSGKYGDWEHVCWGDPPTGRLGRIPMTLWYAHHVKADHIIWSTGATRVTDGPLEAEILFERALTSRGQLLEDFSRFRFTEGGWSSERAYKTWLRRTALLDTKSENTLRSMDVAASTVCGLDGVQSAEVYLVTSANHAPRVAREAMRTFNWGRKPSAYRPFPGCSFLAVVPAQTNYGGKCVDDVKVLDLGE